MRAEVRRWRGYLFFLLGRGNLVVFILACVKGEAAQGPFVSAAPSLCLRLYVWMPLRRDVKVCGRGECKLGDEWLHVLSCF